SSFPLPRLSRRSSCHGRQRCRSPRSGTASSTAPRWVPDSLHPPCCRATVRCTPDFRYGPAPCPQPSASDPDDGLWSGRAGPWSRLLLRSRSRWYQRTPCPNWRTSPGVARTIPPRGCPCWCGARKGLRRFVGLWGDPLPAIHGTVQVMQVQLPGAVDGIVLFPLLGGAITTRRKQPMPPPEEDRPFDGELKVALSQQSRENLVERASRPEPLAEQRGTDLSASGGDAVTV